MALHRVEGSFRDPEGFVFRRDGTLLRQVHASYAATWERAVTSGVLPGLIADGHWVAHEEAPLSEAADARAWKVLRPTEVPFLSFPYEWSFPQLRDAALLTLEIQRRAVDHGLTLRDASAYNVQFFGHRPVFIDSLSLGAWTEGAPWGAYQQFCRHFLAPLALMAHTDVALGALSRQWVDGVPLPLAARLLPWSTWLRPSLAMHLHLHARASDQHAATGATGKAASGMTRAAMLGLVDSLDGAVRALDWKPAGTEWADYYANTNYTDSARQAKERLVQGYLRAIAGQGPLQLVWDLGANTGVFSRIAVAEGAYTVAWDIDAAAVSRNHLAATREAQTRLLPLVQDLTNPSPSLGWAESERPSLAARGPADAVLALALIHHLCISNNVPLGRVSSYFAQLGRHLVLEFVPKSDSQVRRLLATREDIFPDYTREGLEAAFSEHWHLDEAQPVQDSDRILYRMRRR